jgi:hypothetical protein
VRDHVRRREAEGVDEPPQILGLASKAEVVVRAPAGIAGAGQVDGVAREA